LLYLKEKIRYLQPNQHTRMSKQTIATIQGIEILYHNIEGEDYINLTDISRYKYSKRPELPLKNWINTIELLLAWEQRNNPDFKHGGSPCLTAKKILQKKWLLGKRTNFYYE